MQADMENKLNVILQGLDDNQKAAVCCMDGPVLIVAGAGAGKTRVLTSRIAWCIANGCNPGRILALTFTKKAAGEMKSRIASMVGERAARRIQMGTFHSVFIRFLREYAEKLGYPSSFTIYDTSDSISAISHCIKERKLDDNVYKPKDVLSRISMAKNNLVTPEAYKRNTNAMMNDVHAKKPELCNIYAAYQNVMKQAGVMDFDDILVNMNLLLRDFPEALADIAGRFDYILVDEYQDTNYSQYIILKKLSQFKRNICVVGDDSQSIYAFRGAKIENILNFQKDYPGCKLLRLEQNYRSTQTIVNAANSLIENNEGRIEKSCYSKGEEGPKIHLIKSYTEQEEASLIASSIISTMSREKCEYSDFAILYRTNAQSRALEEALRKKNLPYMIYSGKSFFDRMEVKDMMSYFKLAANPSDDEAFRRIINTPARGIGKTSVDALTVAAASAGCPLMKAAYMDGLENFGLRGAAVTKIRAFTEMMLSFNAKLPDEDAYSLATEISNSAGLYRLYKEDKSIESQSRAANIEELCNSVKLFVENKNKEFKDEMKADGQYLNEEIPLELYPLVSLSDFLEDISLLSSVDVDDEDNNKIALMTVHSAKGLEFSHVYVAGMEENIFPSGGAYASPSEIEEERRLFYVALTRAQTSVNLSFAATRMRNGKHESNSPSRFIHEINSKYIDNPLREDSSEDAPSWSGGFGSGFGQPVSRFGGGFSSRGGFSPASSRTGSGPIGSYASSGRVSYEKSRPTAASSAKSSFTGAPSKFSSSRTPDADFIPVSVLELKVGQRIEHNRFGFGTILSITGKATDLKATIDFDDHGKKILLLKYAKVRLA